MKKPFLILVILIAFVHSTQVNAQEISFSIHGGLQLNAIFNPTGEGFTTIPLPTLQLGFEVGDQTFRGGLRFSSGGLFPFFGALSIETYLKYLQPNDINFYAGFGYTLEYTFLSGSLNEYHLLFGAEIAGGFNLEITPGIAIGTIYSYGPYPSTAQVKTPPYSSKRDVMTFVLGIAIGWSWRF